MNHLLDNPEKLFSSLSSFINDKFKEDIILIQKDLRYSRVHLDIKSKKGILSEDKISDSLKVFFESEGFVIELARPKDPDWKVYRLLKEKDLIGCFNSDIRPNGDHDQVLISVTSNS